MAPYITQRDLNLLQKLISKLINHHFHGIDRHTNPTMQWNWKTTDTLINHLSNNQTWLKYYDQRNALLKATLWYGLRLAFKSDKIRLFDWNLMHHISPADANHYLNPQLFSHDAKQYIYWQDEFGMFHVNFTIHTLEAVMDELKYIVPAYDINYQPPVITAQTTINQWREIIRLTLGNPHKVDVLATTQQICLIIDVNQWFIVGTVDLTTSSPTLTLLATHRFQNQKRIYRQIASHNFSHAWQMLVAAIKNVDHRL